MFAFRFDGFNDAIELSAENLPKGVTCPKQVIGPGQTRGVFVLTADKDAEETEAFVTIVASAGKLKHAARPFTVTWPAVGVQQNQIPNTPMITRMDRGGGLAVAVRGEAAFALLPTETALTAKPGGKVEVTLKVSRKDAFKDPITVLSASPNFGPRPQGNQPLPAGRHDSADWRRVQGEHRRAREPAAGDAHPHFARGERRAGGEGRQQRAAAAAPALAVVPITITIEGGKK